MATFALCFSFFSWRLEKKTLDGAPWYHDEATGEVTWDRPAALSGGNTRRDDGNWVWLQDEKMGYVPAQRVVGKSAVRTEAGELVEPPPASTLFPLALSSLVRVEQDLVMLDAMDEGRPEPPRRAAR